MAENSIYLLCECGFFYGDMRLYERAGIDCPDCGADEADAFASLERALATQRVIVDLQRAEKSDSHASRATRPEDAQAREGQVDP